MTADHEFIDAHRNEVVGREDMKSDGRLISNGSRTIKSKFHIYLVMGAWLRHSAMQAEHSGGLKRKKMKIIRDFPPPGKQSLKTAK